jgi:hypothetical protein
MRFRRIPELRDERMVFQRLLNDAALHTLAASVNQPHLCQASLVRGGDVLDDDRRDIAWREGMKVERTFDRDFLQDGCEAVTIVFIPPRTAKSPTTVMRLG